RGCRERGPSGLPGAAPGSAIGTTSAPRQCTSTTPARRPRAAMLAPIDQRVGGLLSSECPRPRDPDTGGVLVLGGQATRALPSPRPDCAPGPQRPTLGVARLNDLRAADYSPPWGVRRRSRRRACPGGRLAASQGAEPGQDPGAGARTLRPPRPAARVPVVRPRSGGRGQQPSPG